MMTSGLRACEVRIGAVYDTEIAEGIVRARVTDRVPSDHRSRNERFHLVREDTGECLPRFKRATDLRPVR
jgi:hypothetical protein